MKCCGHKAVASWEEYVIEIYAGKCKWKCKKDDKESFLVVFLVYILISWRIDEGPIAHCRQTILCPGGRITLEQYFDVGWLCWWKIDIGCRSYVWVLQIGYNP